MCLEVGGHIAGLYAVIIGLKLSFFLKKKTKTTR